MVQQSGIDAYVKVKFAGNPKAATKCVAQGLRDHNPPLHALAHMLRGTEHCRVIDVRGKKDLAADFNEQLWLPVMTPTMTSTIEVIVMDRDRASSDDRVGTIFLDFRDVRPPPPLSTRSAP